MKPIALPKESEATKRVTVSIDITGTHGSNKRLNQLLLLEGDPHELDDSTL